jgi:hypothetical protein
MIGSATGAIGRAAGIGAALLLGGVLSLRPAAAEAADPSLVASRAAALHRVAAADDAALAALAAGLQAAIEAGRHGSALVIDGDSAPASDLEHAADAASRVPVLALASERSDSALDGTVLSVGLDGAAALPAGTRSGELLGIDRQLRDAAAASGPFVQRRHAATETLDALAAALAALQASDARKALRALHRAGMARATVAAWPSPPVVLPFWLRTTGGMLTAARHIARATLTEDADAAARAGRAYQRAAKDARQADTALALAISETGAGLASTPLQRLADALDAVTARRAALASVLH